MFLIELEKELFEDSSFSHRQNFSREEWKSLRDLAEGKSIVIKSADKGYCVQLSDNKIYRDVKYTKNMLSSLIRYFKVI